MSELLLTATSLTVASDLYRLARESGDTERLREAELGLQRAAIAYTAALHAVVYGDLPVVAISTVSISIRTLRPEIVSIVVDQAPTHSAIADLEAFQLNHRDPMFVPLDEMTQLARDAFEAVTTLEVPRLNWSTQTWERRRAEKAAEKLRAGWRPETPGLKRVFVEARHELGIDGTAVLGRRSAAELALGADRASEIDSRAYQVVRVHVISGEHAGRTGVVVRPESNDERAAILAGLYAPDKQCAVVLLDEIAGVRSAIDANTYGYKCPARVLLKLACLSVA